MLSSSAVGSPRWRKLQRERELAVDLRGVDDDGDEIHRRVLQKMADDPLVVGEPVEIVDAGRSTISTMSAPSSTLLANRSTVMPGQLPTRAEAPVTRLKNVDLPVFGMPTSAMRFMDRQPTTSICRAWLRRRITSVEPSRTCSGPAITPLRTIADPFADAKAHRRQTQAERGVGMDGADGGVGARRELEELNHRRLKRE